MPVGTRSAAPTAAPTSSQQKSPTSLATRQIRKQQQTARSQHAAPSVTTMRNTPNHRKLAGTQTVTSKPPEPSSSTHDKRPSIITARKNNPNSPVKGNNRPASRATTTTTTTASDATSAVEQALREQLKKSETLIASLTEQNEHLSVALDQERSHISEFSRRARSDASYSKQLSRLVRVFRELNVNLPSLDSEQWDAARIAQGVHAYIADSVRDSDDSAVDYNTALELMRLLFGAAEISTSEQPNCFKFVLRNAILQREMSFWLSWTDTTFTYTRINMDIPEKDAPEFWPEDSIEFDVRQGPNFLLQVLGSLFHQQSS